MKSTVNRNNAQSMFALIKTCEESGMNNKTFCEQNGIGQAMFYYWKKKYKETQTPHEKMFIPLHIKGDEASRDAIEICYPNGVRIKISRGTDLSIIRSFIGLL